MTHFGLIVVYGGDWNLSEIALQEPCHVSKQKKKKFLLNYSYQSPKSFKKEDGEGSISHFLNIFLSKVPVSDRNGRLSEFTKANPYKRTGIIILQKQKALFFFSVGLVFFFSWTKEFRPIASISMTSRTLFWYFFFLLLTVESFFFSSPLYVCHQRFSFLFWANKKQATNHYFLQLLSEQRTKLGKNKLNGSFSFFFSFFSFWWRNLCMILALF